MQVDRTRTIVSLGFLSVLALLTILTVLGLSVLHASMERLETVVHTNNLKSRLIVDMRTAARERTVSLQKMLTQYDPFARDEEWMRFNELAGIFVAARATLLNTELTEAERLLLERQAALTRQVGPLQIRIAQDILKGNIGVAHEMLIQEAMPGQDKTFAVLSELLELQEQDANHAVKEAQRDYGNTLTTMLALLAGAAVLSVLIGSFVIRHTAQSERRLWDEKERAQVTLHSIGDGVITTDGDGRVEQMNSAAELLTGWSAEEAFQQPIDKVFRLAFEDAGEPTDLIGKVLKEGTVVSSGGDTVLIRQDGGEFAIEHTAAPIYDRRRSRVAGSIFVFRDVSEMRAMSRQLAYYARHDSLTGLPNRRDFEERLEESLSEVRRYPHIQHWLCYIDLDQFKVINDTCGHQAGDELLKQVAGSLKQHVRESDIVARMGGDEFAILLKHSTHEWARDTVERMRRSLHELRFAWQNKSFVTSASIGLVPVNANSGSYHDLMSTADAACYVAKDQGRNRVHAYEDNDDAIALREGEMQWVHRINRALEEDRFELYHQQIRPLQANKEGLRCEILVRMVDEEGGLVPPMAFIPAAERYNLMGKIDQWVFTHALQTLRSLHPKIKGKDCGFSINVSTQSLCDDDFLPFVLEQLNSSGIDARHLCFEITETCAIANLSRAQRFMSAIRERGGKFSLDDFGSGLSSFGYLKHLPVDYLKIDGSFVRDILDDPIDLALVESINQIGHKLGIETIAEYVDNPKTLTVLKQIGVDYGQGFCIAVPAPLASITAIPADQMGMAAS